MKPEKYGVWDIIKNSVEGLINFSIEVYLDVFNYWDCYYCEEKYSPFVKKFRGHYGEKCCSLCKGESDKRVEEVNKKLEEKFGVRYGNN